MGDGRTCTADELTARLHTLCAQRGCAVMGVLNVTPDSFSDGGQFLDARRACLRVDELLEHGADVIDIGGESTRPGSVEVSAAEQLQRIGPALRHALECHAIVSIDTRSPEVAQASLELGAHLLNDVSCLADEGLAAVAARFDVPLIVMHSRGPMSRMPGFSQWPDDAYSDVVADVRREWEQARERAAAAGLPRERVWFDPGLGFAKNARHSFELLRRLDEFRELEVPVVLGPGRKSFIAAVDASEPGERLGGTVSAALLGMQRGATLVRVHDVREVRQALAVAHAATHGLSTEVVRA